jgi:hypothetical protein
MPIVMRMAEIEKERYQSSGDYSVTTLINPPRIAQLKRRYADEVDPDPDSRIASMMGTALHEYAERHLTAWATKHKYTKMKQEQELTYEEQGRKISGRYDVLEGRDLFDIKMIKTWKLVFDPDFEEFHEQQNLYNLLLHENGTKLKSLNILAFYKDWTESSALRDRTYPQSPVVHYVLDKWPLDKTRQFLEERVAMHIEAEGMSDEELPVCSRKDRWERHQGGEDVHFAVMKMPHAKRATKVVKGGTLEDATKVANGMKGMTAQSFIEIRYAMPKRCVKYCEVAPFCNWYQWWLKQGGGTALNEIVKFKV